MKNQTTGFQCPLFDAKTIVKLASANFLLAMATSHPCSAEPATPYAAPAIKIEWNDAIRQQKQKLVDDYMAKERLGYDWFMYTPPGDFGLEAIPMVLFRILPDLAVRLGDKDPEHPDQPLFGAPAANYAKFGMWMDPRPEYAKRPLPMGFAWTAPHTDKDLSVMVRTCGGCHTSRVRLEDGTTRILEGAPNTEIFVHQFNAAVEFFFERHLQDKASKDELIRAILALVEEKQRESPTWFFKEVEYLDDNSKPVKVDAKEEARQIAVFKQRLDDPAMVQLPDGTAFPVGVLPLIKAINDGRLEAARKLERVSYKNSPENKKQGGCSTLVPGTVFTGPSGFVDASGFGLAAFVPEEYMNKCATKIDPMSVWNSKDRKIFQWVGDIRHILFRNFAAALGISGVPEKLNARGNWIISDFIDGLPPPPYPFAVNTEAMSRGAALYKENCAGCHVADQNRAGTVEPPVYGAPVNTDMNRALAFTPQAITIIRGVFLRACKPGTKFDFKGPQAPCDNVNPADILVDRTEGNKQGYVSPPLDAIWARAPYLHNGSVPTMRHLLVPSLRASATKYLRGSISYDQRNLGWIWNLGDADKYKDKDSSLSVYDTREDGQYNGGHDHDGIYDDRAPESYRGKPYRIVWDANKPEDKQAVDDLIEYLKTL